MTTRRVEVASRYLAQSRVVDDPKATPSPISEKYEADFRHLLRALDIDGEGKPELFVAHTPNAGVETLSFGDTNLIVYDQHLGQAFNRLNDFMLARWPPAYVTQWGLKHLGCALANFDAVLAAAVALKLSWDWNVAGRPVEASQKSLATRSLMTAVQEFFILAHECAHVALRLEAPFVVRPEFDGLVDEVIEINERRDGAEEAIVDQMVADELRVIRANDIAIDEGLVELIRNRAKATKKPALAKALASRSHLREELLCDLVATELTVSFFLENRVPLPVTLTGILLAFHNLTSIENIRDMARKRAKDNYLPNYDDISLRKSFWRTLVPAAFAKGISEEGLRKVLTAATNSHAETVGDQILYILPFEFDRVMDRIEKSDFGEVDREAVMQTVKGIS